MPCARCGRCRFRPCPSRLPRPARARRRRGAGSGPSGSRVKRTPETVAGTISCTTTAMVMPCEVEALSPPVGERAGRKSRDPDPSDRRGDVLSTYRQEGLEDPGEGVGKRVLFRRGRAYGEAVTAVESRPGLVSRSARKPGGQDAVAIRSAALAAARSRAAGSPGSSFPSRASNSARRLAERRVENLPVDDERSGAPRSPRPRRRRSPAALPPSSPDVFTPRPRLTRGTRREGSPASGPRRMARGARCAGSGPGGSARARRAPSAKPAATSATRAGERPWNTNRKRLAATRHGLGPHGETDRPPRPEEPRVGDVGGLLRPATGSSERSPTRTPEPRGARPRPRSPTRGADGPRGRTRRRRGG